MLETVLENIIPIVVSLVLPAITVIANRLVNALAERYDIDIGKEYEERIDNLVRRAIKAVEKRAMAALNRGDEVPSSAEKLEQAIQYVSSELEDLGLKDFARDRIANRIESALFDMEEED